MKLELLSLRAVNCGPLRDVRIDFSDGQGHARPVTLLAGANGSGKTTVLELIAALASLLANVPSREDQFTTTYPSLPYDAQFLEKCEYAVINLLIDDVPLSLLYGNDLSDEPLSGDFFGWVRKGKSGYMGYTPVMRGRFARDTYLRINASLDTVLNYNGKQLPIQTEVPFSLLYIPHFRTLNKIQGTELSQENTEYKPVYRYAPLDSFKGSLEAYLIWLEYSEIEVFRAAQEVISALFPQKKSISIDRKRLKVVVNLSDGGKHDLDELSSGEQNLLITLMELRRRLTPGSIVLIDEIENSLHPAFQHRMAQGLLQLQREVPFQLIVTSQAEDIYQVFGFKSTLVLPMPKYV